MQPCARYHFIPTHHHVNSSWELSGVLIVIPIIEMRTLRPRRWTDSPKLSQLGCSGSGTWIQDCLAPIPFLLTTLLPPLIPRIWHLSKGLVQWSSLPGYTLESQGGFIFFQKKYQCLGPFLEKAMAPHSSTLAWKIPWTEESGRLQTMGSLRVGHDWSTSLSLFPFMHWRRKWQPTPVFLPGESQGWGSLVGCRLWGAQSRTWLKQQQQQDHSRWSNQNSRGGTQALVIWKSSAGWVHWAQELLVSPVFLRWCLDFSCPPLQRNSRAKLWTLELQAKEKGFWKSMWPR